MPAVSFKHNKLNVSYTETRYVQLRNSVIRSVHHAPKRRGRSGFNYQWRREILSVYSKVGFLLKHWNSHTIELMLIYLWLCEVGVNCKSLHQNVTHLHLYLNNGKCCHEGYCVLLWDVWYAYLLQNSSNSFRGGVTVVLGIFRKQFHDSNSPVWTFGEDVGKCAPPVYGELKFSALRRHLRVSQNNSLNLWCLRCKIIKSRPRDEITLIALSKVYLPCVVFPTIKEHSR